MPDGECVMLRNKRQSGQALVAATVGLVALLAATGLAIDVGYLRYQKRLQQSAADSAALAGAAEIKFGGSGGVTKAAQQDSSLNGFTDNGSLKNIGDVTVAVSNGPADGPNAGKPEYVEVIVSAVQPTFFMKILGVNQTTVAARAVAVLGGGGARGCLYTLGLGGAGGITTNGTASIDAPNCGILDDSTLTKNGSGHITAASIGTVGAVTDHGGGAITPTPISGIIAAADPLSYLTPPAVGGCTTQNGTIQDTKKDKGGTVNLTPGNFCGGISVSGTKDVNFAPGTYVISAQGGKNGIDFGGNGTISGTGVTFYFTATGGSITFHGNQTIKLTAPTAGNYAGILFYQNQANATAATLDGNNGSKFEGALYFPGAPLNINGAAGSTSAYMIVVVKSVTLNGATLALPADYSGLPGGSPIKDAVLVE
jgi:hypothetical protein